MEILKLMIEKIPIKNKCPENVRKIVQTNSGQIPETECPEIISKRVHFPTFRICPEPVFVQFLSRICPENIQIFHFNFSQIYSLISAEFIIKFQLNLELNISKIYI